MENKNGSGIFLGVVGVATLVVAIIGATFAYFSAAVTPAEGSDEIKGNTNSDVAGALELTVERVVYEDTTAASLDLVPATFDPTSASGISKAVAKKCEIDGYTGCHVYKITATTTQSLAHANIYIDSLTTTATESDDWSYTVYTGTELSATGYVMNGTFDSITAAKTTDMHKNAALTSGTPAEYYLVIYLAEDSHEQNDGKETDSTGTYTGTVSMEAAGGRVTANFTASA